jgi:hypothetical protein
MSTTEHEAHHRSIDHDVEIRVKNFRNATIVALCNFTILIILVGMFWFYIQVVPPSVPIPFPMRWIYIVVLYFHTVSRNAWLIHIICAIARTHISEIEDASRSRTRDLETRTTDFEDWILANFCVISGLSTIALVGWYWVEVIKLTARLTFFWTCTGAGLWLLFRLFKGTIRFYRRAKTLKHEQPSGFLISVIARRLFNKLEQFLLGGTLEKFLGPWSILSEIPNSVLCVIGFQIGRGPLFGELPRYQKSIA